MLDVANFLHGNFDVVVYGSPPSDYRVDCPFCASNVNKADYKKKLYVSMHKQVVHCFRCEYSATWVKFVQDYLGCTYVAALGELYTKPRARKITEDDFFFSVTKKSVELSLPLDFVPLYGSRGFKSYKRYLRSRGFGVEHWRKYNLGTSSKYPMRVIIPIEDGYWQGRSILGSVKPKYVNPKVGNSDYIFNPTALQLYDEVVICEGAFSAMSVGDNAIAILGSSGRQKSHRLAKSSVSTFIIALEPGAYSKMHKLADYLRNYDKGIIIWEYADGDPNSSVDGYVTYQHTLQSKVRKLVEKTP